MRDQKIRIQGRKGSYLGNSELLIHLPPRRTAQLLLHCQGEPPAQAAAPGHHGAFPNPIQAGWETRGDPKLSPAPVQPLPSHGQLPAEAAALTAHPRSPNVGGHHRDTEGADVPQLCPALVLSLPTGLARLFPYSVSHQTQKLPCSERGRRCLCWQRWVQVPR